MFQAKAKVASLYQTGVLKLLMGTQGQVENIKQTEVFIGHWLHIVEMAQQHTSNLWNTKIKFYFRDFRWLNAKFKCALIKTTSDP